MTPVKGRREASRESASNRLYDLHFAMLYVAERRSNRHRNGTIPRLIHASQAGGAAMAALGKL